MLPGQAHNAEIPPEETDVPEKLPPTTPESPGRTRNDANTLLSATDLRLVHIVLWLFIGLGFPLSLLANLTVDYPLQPRDFFFPLVIPLIGACTFWLLRKQKIRPALLVFLWGLAALICLKSMAVNGIRSPVIAALPVIVVLSAWLTGTRHTVLLCASLIAVLSGMAIFEPQFWPVQLPRTPFQFWSTYSFCIVMGAIVAGSLASAMRRHFQAQQTSSQALAEHVLELQREREKFSAFFYLNPVPVSITLLADGSYYDVNPAWEALSGWRSAEIRGKTSLQLGIWVTPEERDEWVNEFRKNGRSERQLTRFRLRDGKIRYFLASAEVIHYNDQPCIFSAFVDVTERREAEEKLRELNASLEARVAERTQRLAEANQSLAHTVESLQRAQSELVHAETMASLGAMVAGISHELNTPIGNALTVSTALQDQVREFSSHVQRGDITRQALHNFLADQSHGADLASQNMLRAAELVTSFKQVAVDQASERRRGFELADTLGDILNTLRPMLKHQPIELRTDFVSNIAMDSFPGPLGQVISNLVQNALLHGLDQNGGVIEIGTRALDAERIEITVSDNGRGIKAENLPRIFDPFFTTRLGQGGSGLGLSIVHRLVSTVLGGSISVHSVEGEGCRFRVEIPRIAPQNTEA